MKVYIDKLKETSNGLLDFLNPKRINSTEELERKAGFTYPISWGSRASIEVMKREGPKAYLIECMVRNIETPKFKIKIGASSNEDEHIVTAIKAQIDTNSHKNIYVLRVSRGVPGYTPHQNDRFGNIIQSKTNKIELNNDSKFDYIGNLREELGSWVKFCSSS